MSEAPARPWITYALIAANVAMFGFEIANGASPIAPTGQQLLDLGASYPPLTLNGEWWRLGSSMFLHFGILHIALNMLCLYQARVVEQLFGKLGFSVIYVVAGLGGGIASLIVGSDHGVMAGASGAVFGVYGAFGAFLVLRRAQIDALAWQRTARSLGRFLVLNLVIGLAVTSVSVSVHAGGVIVGFGVGAALLVGSRAPQQRLRRALGLLVAGLALTAVAVRSLHAAPAIPPVLTRYDAAERAVYGALNAARTRAEAGQLDDARYADLLEHEVIAPYRKAREDVLAADVPERWQPMLGRLDEFTAARLAAWEAFDAVLRETDPDKRRLRNDAFKALDADLARKLEALKAELPGPAE